MAVSGTIANGFIKIALDGYETAKAKITQLQTEVKKVGESLSTIGSISAKGFAVATGSIVGFLKAADPVRMTIFTQKLMILSMHIGQVFIPILKEAIAILDRLIAYFSNLSKSQQDQILKWTKIVVSILAVGVAIGVAVKAISTLITVLRALSVIVGILESETGIGLVLALVALAIGIYEVIKNSKEFAPILDALESAWDTLTEAMKPVIDAFKGIFAQINMAATGIISKLIPVLDAVIHVFERLIPPIVEIIQVLAELYQAYVASAMKVYDRIFSQSGQVIPIIQKLGHIWQETFQKIASIMKQVQPAIEKMVEAIMDLYATVAELVIDVLGDLYTQLAELGKMLYDTFGDEIVMHIKAMAAVITEVVREIKVAYETAKELYDLYKRFREGTKNALDHLNPFTEGNRSDRKEAERQKLEKERKQDQAKDKAKHDDREKKEE